MTFDSNSSTETQDSPEATIDLSMPPSQRARAVMRAVVAGFKRQSDDDEGILAGIAAEFIRTLAQVDPAAFEWFKHDALRRAAAEFGRDVRCDMRESIAKNSGAASGGGQRFTMEMRQEAYEREREAMQRERKAALWSWYAYPLNGLNLGDSTAEQIRTYVAEYRKQITGMEARAKFFEDVAAATPKGKMVRQVLTLQRLEELAKKNGVSR